MQTRRPRFLFQSVIAVALLMVGIAALIWANRPSRSLRELISHPGVPQPSASDASTVELTATGVPLTVKQQNSGWLPGGLMKLCLDDITGKQVLISVTKADGTVIFGPKSVKTGDRVIVKNGVPTDQEIEIVRLKNLLAGGDFGEFLIRPGVTVSKTN